jgi:iron uptake system EfeUOB component EfeO/EfeM
MKAFSTLHFVQSPEKTRAQLTSHNSLLTLLPKYKTKKGFASFEKISIKGTNGIEITPACH